MRHTVNRVLDLLTPAERHQLRLLLPLVMLMALLEVIGIASITPFLALVGNPEAIRQGGWLNWAFDQLGFDSEQTFLIFLGAVSLTALLISNAFAAFMAWHLRRFADRRGFSLSTRLMKHYLSQPYVFFLGRNSADLARNLLNEVLSVVNGILMPGLELIAKATATLFVIALVFAVDPVLAIVAFVAFGATYGAIFQLVKAQLSRLGKRRLDASRQRFRAANEAIGAVKDLKLMGRESFFLQRFTVGADRFASANTRSYVIGAVPRYALETLAFGGVLVVVITLLGVGRDLGQVLPVIGVYAFAVYRLMPSLQTIFSSITSIRYNTAALDSVSDDMSNAGKSRSADIGLPVHDSCPLPFKRSIEMLDLGFRYPGASRTTVSDVTLEIPANTMVAFVGATGSGKTTIVDLILGLLEPDEGSLLVDGVPIAVDNVRRWQRNLGYVPQHIYLADDTVTANIALGIPTAQVDRIAVERAAKAAQIHGFVTNELPMEYDTVVGERGVRLSGGQRQRIGIARALYHDPKILVFDEATSALDGATEAEVFQAIEALKGFKTIILIAHRLGTVRACHQVFLVEKGRVIAQNTYDGLLRDSVRFRELAGEPL